MASRHVLRTAGLSLVLMAGCTGSNTEPIHPGDGQSNRQFNQIEQRLEQVERKLRLVEWASEADSKTPTGPLRSLTLRLGTTDDRLRMYWADGQTSDLLCNEEGKGTWACG